MVYLPLFIMTKEEILGRIINILTEIYDKECFEITEGNSPDEKMLTIHFAEVDLVNYYNQHHIIRDLFLTYKILLSKHDFVVYFLLARKATWTVEEAYKRYLHSHIGTGAFEATYCCYGTTSINELASELRSSNSRGSIKELEEKFDYFELFLYQLNEWIKYESTTTTPYFRISNLVINNDDIIIDVNATNIDRILYLNKVRDIPLIQNTGAGQRFLVQDNELFKEQLLSLFGDQQNLIRYIDENGREVYTPTNDNFNIKCQRIKNDFLSQFGNRIIKFHGKDFPITVLLPKSLEEKKEVVQQKVIVKSFRDSLKALLEAEINKFYYDREYQKYSSKIRRTELRFHPQTDYILES